MKTNMYSISKKAAFAAAIAMLFSFTVRAQFITPSPDNPQTQGGEEVRTGSVITYDLSGNHNPGEQYRWAVIGGEITDSNNGDVGTPSGDSSIVEFTANTFEIEVTWDEDLTATPIGSFGGEIMVQKRTGTGACPSQMQILPVTQWNNPTAQIDAADADFDICSGDAVGGNITIDLTGAPDNGGGDGFVVTYDVSATNLEDAAGNPITEGTGLTAVGNGSTIDISLPSELINTDAINDAEYTITLTAMHDDFQGPGSVINKTEFTITVHPTVVTGPIQSSSQLTRR